MKEVAKNYLKTASIIFVTLFVLYVAFESLVLKSHFDFFTSIIKVLLLAVLLPLFSKKYLAQVSSREEIDKFSRNRRYLYVFIGGLLLISAILAVIFYLTNKSSIK
jgi:uncharacterized membrane protein